MLKFDKLTLQHPWIKWIGSAQMTDENWVIVREIFWNNILNVKYVKNSKGHIQKHSKTWHKKLSQL